MASKNPQFESKIKRRSDGKFTGKPNGGQPTPAQKHDVDLTKTGFSGATPVNDFDAIKRLTTHGDVLVGGPISGELWESLATLAFDGPSRNCLDEIAETAHNDLWDRLESVEGLSHYEWDERRPERGCTFYLDVVVGNRDSSLDATPADESLHNATGDLEIPDVSKAVKVAVIFGRYSTDKDDLDGPMLWAVINDEGQWTWAE